MFFCPVYICSYVLLGVLYARLRMFHSRKFPLFDEPSCAQSFKPVEDRIEFDGKKVYQEDIFVISAELATKMTYPRKKLEFVWM